MFEGCYYQQVFGTAIGSPVSAVIANLVMGRCPQLFKNYFTFNSSEHSRVTRQSHKLHLPRVRTEQAKKSFYYNGCVVYNNKRK